MLKILGKKVGMTHIYEDNGVSVALTIIQLYDNKVLEISQVDKSRKVVVAFKSAKKTKNINKSIVGFYSRKQIPLHEIIKSSDITSAFPIDQGQSIDYSLVLKKGDKVSISGITAGKGFAGVMKRWNFRGLEASHGVSISHRSHGSTGQRQDPGKTFKGKKMAGHLGVDRVTIKNLYIEYFDVKNFTIGVKGSVPGKNGSEMIIKLNNL